MAKYEFAIKKDVLNSGNIIYTPVCRRRPLLNISLFSNPWSRIVNIYGNYLIMELDFIPDLSYEDCKEHISGFQEKLQRIVENEIAQVEFDTLEVQEF